MLITFPAYGRSASCTFKCLACQKYKRKRTFRVEHTVNPYNTNPDGSQKQAAQVSQEAQVAANLDGAKEWYADISYWRRPPRRG